MGKNSGTSGLNSRSVDSAKQRSQIRSQHRAPDTSAEYSQCASDHEEPVIRLTLKALAKKMSRQHVAGSGAAEIFIRVHKRLYTCHHQTANGQLLFEGVQQGAC